MTAKRQSLLAKITITAGIGAAAAAGAAPVIAAAAPAAAVVVAGPQVPGTHLYG